MKLTEKLLKEQIEKVMNEATGRSKPLMKQQTVPAGAPYDDSYKTPKFTQKDPELPPYDDSKKQAAQDRADKITNQIMSTADDPAKASSAKTRKAKDALDQRLRGLGIYQDVVGTDAYVDAYSELEKMVNDKGTPFDGNRFSDMVDEKAEALAPRSFFQKAGNFFKTGRFKESITLSSNDIRRMIQEELENVLETRTFGGRPDGYMYPGEEEERMRQLGMMKNAQVSPEDKPPSPSMPTGPERFNSFLMGLEKECEEDGPGSEACMELSKMEQFMYGQGDRMHEGKKKRKKNG